METRNLADSICLDEWEKQIIYGALLGNAFIVDPPKGLHCYLVLRQSKRQDPNLFLYKVNELKAFARKSAVYSDSRDYRWTSISHRDFGLIRDFCYKNKRKHVTMDWLNLLRDVSLMIWYLDRGFYKNKQLGINIVNLKESGSVIRQYFNEVGMTCNLKCSKIIFDEKGKNEFLRVIAHRVPPSLYYRLSEARDIKMPKSLVYNLELPK